MLKFKLLEMTVNKYSDDFRQQQYFAFDVVCGACLSSLLSEVDMSSFYIYIRKHGSVYLKTGLLSQSVPGEPALLPWKGSSNIAFSNAFMMCDIIKCPGRDFA